MRALDLSILPQSFAVCRLEPSAPVPGWAAADGFWSVTRTEDEISLLCSDDAVPPGSVANRGWRAIRVAGPLDFALTGILASLATPLADAGISIFALSTHDTDYVLVKDESLGRAVEALTAAGHRLVESEP